MKEQKDQGVQISLEKIGINDQIPYTKIDITKVCRLNTNFALSFYQFDYQAVALSINGISSIKPEDTKLMPVAKVVMDINSLNQLMSELNNLKDLLEKQSTKQK